MDVCRGVAGEVVRTCAEAEHCEGRDEEEKGIGCCGHHGRAGSGDLGRVPDGEADASTAFVHDPGEPSSADR